MNSLGFFACLLLAWPAAGAQAPSVALAGMLGGKALLVVGGTAPKAVAAGEAHQGVKVLSTSGEEAVVEQAGQRQTLRVGQAPVSLGTGGHAGRIVLTEGGGGHFMAAGQVNGRAVQFMVDTGATHVVMSPQDAERAGIAYRDGQPVQLTTANGPARGYRIRLDSVRVGDVQVYEVEAVVIPQPMPFVLLGNSFLSRFQMKRENQLLTLERRY